MKYDPKQIDRISQAATNLELDSTKFKDWEVTFSPHCLVSRVKGGWECLVYFDNECQHITKMKIVTPDGKGWCKQDCDRDLVCAHTAVVSFLDEIKKGLGGIEQDLDKLRG